MGGLSGDYIIANVSSSRGLCGYIRVKGDWQSVLTVLRLVVMFQAVQVEKYKQHSVSVQQHSSLVPSQ